MSLLEADGVAQAPPYRATLYGQATPATVYWRCTLPGRYLPGRVEAAEKLAIIQGEDNSLTFPDLENDTAVVQFPGDQGTAVCLMALQSQGKRILIEADDNYLGEGDPLWRGRAGWGAKIGDAPHTREGHRWIVEHADGVIVTTPVLAALYGEHNDNVTVARNSIDPDDWPEYVKPDDGIFRIGWYASGSHDRDQDMVRKAMAWASRQPDVEIVNIGLNPTGWNFTRSWIGWRDDFLEHRHELLKLDVGISPLIGTPMTKYRSDLKALEYGMSGAYPILQGYPPYDEWRDVEYARVCWTEADWMNAIRWAVTNRDEVRARGQMAREHVLEHRTFATEIEQWRKAVSVED